MSNINLRKFKEKDLKNIGECIKDKIIPIIWSYPPVYPKAVLEKYIERNMENEPALAIIDAENDNMLGAIDAILVDNVLITSYYIIKKYQKQGICTEALGLFIEYIRKNNPDVSQIKLIINISNNASRIVAIRNGFKRKEFNEFGENWILDL